MDTRKDKMTFKEACKKKFDRGAKEHNDWDKIDHRREMQDELCDLYNYATKEDNDELKREIQGFAEYMWKRLWYNSD